MRFPRLHCRACQVAVNIVARRIQGGAGLEESSRRLAMLDVRPLMLTNRGGRYCRLHALRLLAPFISLATEPAPAINLTDTPELN